jgi:hypothetical protein
MRPYLDAGFLLTLLVRTGGSAIAAEILRSHTLSFSVNLLHQLQAENFIAQLERATDAAERKTGNGARLLWQYFFTEKILEADDADWTNGLRLALAWTIEGSARPSPPLLTLHPALAVVAGCTHFLSFDPRSRAVAEDGGLQLLPAYLQ